MKNQWKSTKINKNQYKTVVFRVHSVRNADFDENYAILSAFCMISRRFCPMFNDFGGFLIVLWWNINEDQWKWTKLNENIKNEIKRGSNHVVYDVVAAAFLEMMMTKFFFINGLRCSVVGREGCCAVQQVAWKTAANWGGWEQCAAGEMWQEWQCMQAQGEVLHGKR